VNINELCDVQFIITVEFRRISYLNMIVFKKTECQETTNIFFQHLQSGMSGTEINPINDSSKNARCKIGYIFYTNCKDNYLNVKCGTLNYSRTI